MYGPQGSQREAIPSIGSIEAFLYEASKARICDALDAFCFWKLEFIEIWVPQKWS